MSNVMILYDNNNQISSISPAINLYSFISVYKAIPMLKKIRFDIIIINEELCSDNVYYVARTVSNLQDTSIWLISKYNDAITHIFSSKCGISNILPLFDSRDILYKYISYYLMLSITKKGTAVCNSSKLTVDKLTLDFSENLVYVDANNPKSLSSRQTSILKCLMSRPNHTVLYDTICLECLDYPDDYEFSQTEYELIRPQIHAIRKTLKILSNCIDASDYIKTRHNQGYSFTTLPSAFDKPSK